MFPRLQCPVLQGSGSQAGGTDMGPPWPAVSPAVIHPAARLASSHRACLSGTLHQGPQPSPGTRASLHTFPQVPVSEPGAAAHLPSATPGSGITCPHRSPLPRACPCARNGTHHNLPYSRGWARSNCCKERWGYLPAHGRCVCSTSIRT